MNALHGSRAAVDADDIDLIARVLANDDRHAFAALVQRHQAAVRAFLVRLTRGDHACADDLAQETFIQCYRALARFRGGSQFRTWLLGIAYNQYRGFVRRSQPAADLAGATADEPGAALEPAHTTSSDLQHDLAAAVATLSSEQQAVIHLCFREGLSHSEASCVLDWPLGSVKTHLLRAKEKLRQHLSAWAPG